MSTWRDTATPQAQADLDGLVGVAIEFAQQQLAHGEFFPFAIAVALDGEVEMVAGRPDHHDEHPNSSDVLDACFSALRDRRGQIRAAAVASDVRITNENRDAIRIDLEHYERVALVVLLPYMTKKFRRDVEYGELRAEAGQRLIWD